MCRQGRTYALDRRCEENVQDEERWCTDPAFDQVPPVIFATDLVATTAPVVERQSYRPQHAESHHIVHSLRLETVHPSPHSIVNVVQGRQDRPHAVYLTPVPVDLRNDEEDWEERQREREARDNWVRRGVNVLQSLKVANVGEDLLGERVELRNVGLYGCAVGGTVGECLDYGHGCPSWWSDEHVGGSEQCWWYGKERQRA
jgi:hypothetical protein